MRLHVADGAVVVDQAVDLRLLEAVDEGGGHRGGAGEHGQLAAEAERESLEKRAPRRVDGLGILEPAQIVILDQVGVGAGGKGGGDHGRRAAGAGRPAARAGERPAAVGAVVRSRTVMQA